MKKIRQCLKMLNYKNFYFQLIVIFFLSFLLFFGSWFVLYKTNINSLPIQSEDIVPSVFTGIAIIKEGTIYLNGYYEMMIQKYPQPDDSTRTPFYLKKVGDNHLSAFPILSSIVALPVFFIYILIFKTISWEDIYLLSHLSGAFIVSLCAVFFFYLLKEVLKVSIKNSLIILLIYLFATVNFSLISQGLWQHGVVQMFSILGIIFYFKKNYFFMSLFLGFGILARPTALIILVVLGVFILINRDLSKKTILQVFFGVLIPFVFFIFYNQAFYKDISNQGYASQLFDSWTGNFPESFFGIWVSPSKGVLIYSPVIIFSLITIYFNFKKNEYLKISFWVILLHTLVMSKWKHWYGGFGFGYRMISDIIPFLIIPLVFFVEHYYKKLKLWFYLTLVVSVIIQVSGLVFYDSIWHNAYDKGFNNTSWLWSLENSEAVFNIRRVLVKVGYLDRACDKCEPGNLID